MKVLRLVAALWLVAGFSPSASAQAQTLFREDFENGAPGWTYYIVGGGISSNLWHIALPGQCSAAASSKMCAYNDADCDYQNTSSHNGMAEAPEITLSGQPPYSISLNHLRSVDLPGSTTTSVEFRITSTTNYTVLSTNHSNTSTMQTITAVFPARLQPGDAIRVRFRFSENSLGNSGLGWLVDDVLVQNSGPDPGTAYCFCDSGSPCSNPYPTGGCENSTGAGALLAVVGSASVTSDNLVFTASQLRPNQNGIVYMGAGQIELPFGDGERCVGAGGVGLFRFPVHNSGAGGSFNEGPVVGHSHSSFPPAGQIQAGDTWNFQAWYRDPPGPCGSGFNLSHGVSVAFSP